MLKSFIFTQKQRRIIGMIAIIIVIYTILILIFPSLSFADDLETAVYVLNSSINENNSAMELLAQDIGQLVSFLVGAICSTMLCICLTGWA